MPINQPGVKRAWGIPRRRISLDVPVPFANALERYKQWSEKNHGTKPTTIDFLMNAALQQCDQLRKFHDDELKNNEGVKYATNINGIKAPRKRPSPDQKS